MSNIKEDMEQKRAVSNKFIIWFFLLILIVVEILQIINLKNMQTIIVISNIQIVLLLIATYKFLKKGLLISIFFNIISGSNLLIEYLSANNPLYFQMFFYCIISIFLSTLICCLATRQVRYVSMLKQNTNYDSLTETFNHHYFQERIEIEFNSIKRSNSNLGLIMIDIDNFKHFNEICGHLAGDDLLITTANIISSSAGVKNLVCRYGGDEFAIIMPYTQMVEIQTVTNDIIKNYSEFIDAHDNLNQLNMSLSLGYSLYPNLAINTDELISQADNALYHAIQSGRKNVKIYKDIFTDIMHSFSSTENQLLTSLKTLLGTVSAKDRYTLGHSERVLEYSMYIGQELGMSEEQLKILKLAALLHDVGKVEIPQEILNKKGKLTEEEFAIVRLHPQYSEEIIRPLSKDDNISLIVRHHHERYDGFGYPDGLQGEQIPFESRILTVADSFDAMLSNRPYRQHLLFNEAISELEDCSEKQFDKNIVEIFIKILKNKKLGGLA